ncbi:MAG TPA: glycosyltransferase [Candidatus Acidoferrales bacterium]|nr:glycosyltransferase [Candidatus Acidoferrales bacterium]
MTYGLDISFFGSSLVSAYWNGAATYYRGIIRALARRGHRITFYEPDIFRRQEFRDIEDPPWCRVVVYPGGDEQAVWAALEEASCADLLIKTSGIGQFDELLEGAVLEARSTETLVAFWDVDAPATLDRVAETPGDPFRALIPRFDLILTYGGGAPVVQGYKDLCARNCVPIYNALDPETHFPAPPDLRFAGDLALLANRLPDREARIEEFFLGAAELAPGRRFLLGGNGWAEKSMPQNVAALGHIFTRDHNAFNCTPRAVLNVNRESMARFGYSPATRIFEAAGAAACLITDEWEGIEMFLEPGREVLVARSGEEVAEHLNALTPQRASSIGRSAYCRVIAEHTYERRAAQLESLLDATFRPRALRRAAGGAGFD